MFIYPTVDVEGVHGSDPYEQLAWGRVGDKEDWGVLKIGRIFHDAEVVGTFFVDIYEHSLWGMDTIRDLCLELQKLGQDVQLHTHPGWRIDIKDSDELQALKKEKSYLAYNKDFMAKLSYQEQVNVLQHGIDLLTDWMGKRPIAHRSGGYSINADTLRALKSVGIELDSSMNAAHVHSEVTWSNNRPVYQDEILQIPINTYDLSFAGGLYKKRMKLDLDLNTTREFMIFTQQAPKLGIPVLNLFMHSYSLLNFDYDYKHITPDPTDAKKLADWVRLLKSESAKFVTSTDLLKRKADWVAPVNDTHIPQIPASYKIARLGLRKIAYACRNRFLH